MLGKSTRSLERALASNKAVEAILPSIKLMVERAGHCVRRAEVDKVYGHEVVEFAIMRGVVKRHLVVVRDVQNRVPPTKIDSVVTDAWDMSKPLWIGE